MQVAEGREEGVRQASKLAEQLDKIIASMQALRDTSPALDWPAFDSLGLKFDQVLAYTSAFSNAVKSSANTEEDKIIREIDGVKDVEINKLYGELQLLNGEVKGRDGKRAYNTCKTAVLSWLLKRAQAIELAGARREAAADADEKPGKVQRRE